MTTELYSSMNSQDKNSKLAGGVNVLAAVLLSFALAVCLQAQGQINWRQLTPPSTKAVYSVVFSNSGEIIVGTGGAGIFRSSDGGVTWALSSLGLTSAVILSIASHSSNTFLAASQDSGAFRSFDGAKSWGKVNLQKFRLETATISSSGDFFVGGEYVYRSTDSGSSWTRLYGGVIKEWVRSIAINSQGHIFVGSDGGLFRSTDNGTTWVLKANGLPTYGLKRLAISPNGNIFASVLTPSGPYYLYRSLDNGETWQNTAFFASAAHGLVVNKSGHIFAGTSSPSSTVAKKKHSFWVGMGKSC